MKKTLFLICACTVLFAVAILCTACSGDVRNVNLSRDSLSSETWLEVEKNEVVKICIDTKVRVWDNAPNTKVLNDSCLKYRVPTLVGVHSINVKFLDSDSSHKINLAIGMKYLDFKNEETLYGNDSYQMNPFSKKIVQVSGSYLVDKYPVTNCEFLQLLWNEIPQKSSKIDSMKNDFINFWVNRKESGTRNEKCIAHDSAASSIPLYLAMKYANIRSVREGLKPYYIFSNTRSKYVRIDGRAMSVNRNNVEKVPEHHYFIPYHDFKEHVNNIIEVYDDSSSDGYRLPYYDEWVMLARGGNKNNTPWKDSASFKEISKYAKFDDKIKCSDLDESVFFDKIKSYFHWCKNDYESGPVGKLLPNGFGLYDMFGLVEEQVLLEKHNYSREDYGVFFCVERKEEKKREPFECKNDCPACLKGGIRRSDLERIDYSYISNNYVPKFAGGFRLIRNIGNNAKWTEVKSETK
jgi:formylglycine-generating enzyme required for sulfatase activity